MLCLELRFLHIRLRFLRERCKYLLMACMRLCFRRGEVVAALRGGCPKEKPRQNETGIRHSGEKRAVPSLGNTHELRGTRDHGGVDGSGRRGARIPAIRVREGKEGGRCDSGGCPPNLLRFASGQQVVRATRLKSRNDPVRRQAGGQPVQLTLQRMETCTSLHRTHTCRP